MSKPPAQGHKDNSKQDQNLNLVPYVDTKSSDPSHYIKLPLEKWTPQLLTCSPLHDIGPGWLLDQNNNPEMLSTSQEAQFSHL